jgi:hypothetical protein
MRVSILAFVLLAAPSALACCPAYPAGARVAVADQEVLIAYDAATKREHFVRRAAFNTGEQAFGFLVPTPTQPELAEAPNSVFSALREAIKPRIEWVNDYQLTPAALCLCFLALGSQDAVRATSAAAGFDSVNVLDEARVAGYDAVVLEASDADALVRWLEAHGYDARPELTDWVKPYVAAGWKVTAFKYAADQEGGAVSTKAVRLSFDTDRPLFPYRVPTDQIAPEGAGNLLRLYYVGATRAQGMLGSVETSAWGAKTAFAAPLENAPALLGDAVPGIAAGVWLTAFEDETWPSGTEDLYFSDVPDAESLIPVITRKQAVPLFIPFDVILLLIGGFAYWRHKRRPGEVA